MGESKGLVAVPTMKGIGSSFKDFGVGLLGGVLFLIAYSLFGGWGILAAPLLAGSMIKGSRGETMALMAGFMLIALGVMGGNSTSSNGTSSRGVM